MDRLADAVILSWGWRRRGLALAAGALSALAQPPFFLFPILWLTFPVLVWLIDGAVGQGSSGRVRRLVPAFAVGWWFGFGYFLAGLWWIGDAFLVEADTFAWLMPLAVLGLPAALALFWGAGTAAAQMLWSEGWPRIFALAAGLGAAEWLRGHLFTGFPWNAIGYALTAGEALMQSAALFGVETLSVIAVAIFAAPAVLARHGAASARRAYALPALALAAVAVLGLYGVIRLSQAPVAFVPDVTLRVVQPNLAQLQKWDPENRDEVLRTYLDLSSPDGAPLPAGTVLVWPESAFPFALTQDPEALAAIARVLAPGAALVTGAYRSEPNPDGPPLVYNSIYVVGGDGTILDSYDKTHLVPFGEYLPGGKMLSDTGLRQLVQGGFLPGVLRRSLNLPSSPPFVPLICYEAIFPGAVLPDGPRPGYILNVTNDGWFGKTIGPYQHAHQARIRAVEEGLPLVRAANTGISLITDGYGRLQASQALGSAGVLDARLPVAAPATFYAKWRNLSLILSMVAAVAVAFAGCPQGATVSVIDLSMRSRSVRTRRVTSDHISVFLAAGGSLGLEPESNVVRMMNDAPPPPGKRPNPTDIYVGSRVRMRRKMLGLSQEKLGEKLGITFQQIQKYEKGTNRVGASRLQAMAGALEVPVSYFFPDAAASAENPGMQEEGAGFMMDLMSTSEGLELSRAFVRIGNAKVRRKVVDLVRALAEENKPA